MRLPVMQNVVDQIDQMETRIRNGINGKDSIDQIETDRFSLDRCLTRVDDTISRRLNQPFEVVSALSLAPWSYCNVIFGARFDHARCASFEFIQINVTFVGL